MKVLCISTVSFHVENMDKILTPKVCAGHRGQQGTLQQLWEVGYFGALASSLGMKRWLL